MHSMYGNVCAFERAVQVAAEREPVFRGTVLECRRTEVVIVCRVHEHMRACVCMFLHNLKTNIIKIIRPGE